MTTLELINEGLKKENYKIQAWLFDPRDKGMNIAHNNSVHLMAIIRPIPPNLEKIGVELRWILEEDFNDFNEKMPPYQRDQYLDKALNMAALHSFGEFIMKQIEVEKERQKDFETRQNLAPSE